MQTTKSVYCSRIQSSSTRRRDQSHRQSSRSHNVVLYFLPYEVNLLRAKHLNFDICYIYFFRKDGHKLLVSLHPFEYFSFNSKHNLGESWVRWSQWTWSPRGTSLIDKRFYFQITARVSSFELYRTPHCFLAHQQKVARFEFRLIIHLSLFKLQIHLYFFKPKANVPKLDFAFLWDRRKTSNSNMISENRD